jgi:hypothetical protein
MKKRGCDPIKARTHDPPVEKQADLIPRRAMLDLINENFNLAFIAHAEGLDFKPEPVSK